MSRDSCVALSHGAMGLSEVCDCGISRSYSLTIFGAFIITLRGNRLEIQSKKRMSPNNILL